MHDPIFDQRFAKTTNFRLEIVLCTEHLFPWLRFCLLVIVLALALAVLVAICFNLLVLRFGSALYVPLGHVRSGGKEGLMKSSVSWLLIWKNISKTRKQVGEVDVVTSLDLSVHIGQEP